MTDILRHKGYAARVEIDTIEARIKAARALHGQGKRSG